MSDMPVPSVTASRIHQAARHVVVAALPLPFFLSAGLVQRQDLLWFFIADLGVAMLAVTLSSRPVAVTSGRWSFMSRARP